MSDITIVRGKTFSRVYRWEQPTLVYKAISAISQAGAPVITATAHGVPDGWRVAVVSVKGMTEINAANWPLKDKDFEKAVVLLAKTVELNEVNAADLKAYTSGGYLVYHAPVVLTGFSARMTIKDKVGGTTLETLTIAGGEIAIDTANYKITLTLSATDTAAYTWKKGVYDLEMVSADVTPVVTLLDSGAVAVEQEVTT